jgi:hypothetical protein
MIRKNQQTAARPGGTYAVLVVMALLGGCSDYDFTHLNPDPDSLCCLPTPGSAAATAGAATNEEFGRSSAIFTFGTHPSSENVEKYIAVGAPVDDGLEGTGAVYVFATDEGTGTIGSSTPVQTLIGNPGADSRFGEALLSADVIECHLEGFFPNEYFAGCGTELLVAAPPTVSRPGTVYVF